MIALICLIALVYWIGTTYGDEAGVIGIMVLGVLLIVLFCKAWSDGSKAHWNRVQYWKNGGPEQYRRKQANLEARIAGVAGKVQAGIACGDAKKPESVTTYADRPVRTSTDWKKANMSDTRELLQANNPAKELFVCPRCCNKVRTVSTKVCMGGKVYRRYWCPKCRMYAMTGI